MYIQLNLISSPGKDCCNHVTHKKWLVWTVQQKIRFFLLVAPTLKIITTIPYNITELNGLVVKLSAYIRKTDNLVLKVPGDKFTTSLGNLIVNYPHLKSYILFRNLGSSWSRLSPAVDLPPLMKFLQYRKFSPLCRDFHFYHATIAVKGGKKEGRKETHFYMGHIFLMGNL